MTSNYYARYTKPEECLQREKKSWPNQNISLCCSNKQSQLSLTTYTTYY